MRKILKFLAIAFALVSCNTEKVTDYTYALVFDCSDTVTAEEYQAAVSYIKTVDYFAKQHTYHGTYSESFQLAADEFTQNCEKLDEAQITSHLKEGELFGIFLLYTENQTPVLALYFTPDEQPAEDE